MNAQPSVSLSPVVSKLCLALAMQDPGTSRAASPGETDSYGPHIGVLFFTVKCL